MLYSTSQPSRCNLRRAAILFCVPSRVCVAAPGSFAWYVALQYAATGYDEPEIAWYVALTHAAVGCRQWPKVSDLSHVGLVKNPRIFENCTKIACISRMSFECKICDIY